MDTLTKKARSLNMSKIRAKNTKPEMLVRRYLYSKGFRYRLHPKLQGKPDIVFNSKRIAVFVNGCFWHQHGCNLSYMPKSNTDFWKTKLNGNTERDKSSRIALISDGWKVLTIWECDINKDLGGAVNPIILALSSY